MLYKLCKWGIVIWSIFCFIGVITGILSVSNTSVSSDAERAGAAIGTAIGLSFWAFLWFLPTVGLGVIALITRPSGNKEAKSTKLCAKCGKYYSGSPKFCPNCGEICDNVQLSSQK